MAFMLVDMLEHFEIASPSVRYDIDHGNLGFPSSFYEVMRHVDSMFLFFFRLFGKPVGGSGPAFAAISVTYPAGATCTCALGSKTFTAPDTSGQALFIVPTAGEWVVSISQSGQQPVSKTVSITTAGQAVTITITFGLIYGGQTSVEFESRAMPLNAQYPASQAPAITNTDEYIQLVMPAGPSQSYISGIYVATNKIDLSDAEKLQVVVDYNSQNTGITQLVVWSQLGQYTNDNQIARTDLGDYSSNPAVGSGTFELDLSGVSGEQYVGFACFGGPNYGSTTKIYSLEVL